MTLRQAGVNLIDCDHRTPPAADAGFPYIAIPQLKDGHLDLTDVRRISEADFIEWTKKLKPRAHDVIVVRRCNSGDSALIPPDLDCAIGQNLVVLRSESGVVHPKFLRWLVRGPEWWDQVGKYINVGAVFDSLRCRDIPNFELTVPPVAEQVAIAEVLDALDDRIALLRETNATLESIAQALFKSWFVDFDPVRAKSQGLAPAGMDEATAALFPDGFEESALGQVPAGWRWDRLESIADVVMGLSPTGDSYNSDGAGVPLVNGPVEYGEYFPVRTKWTTSATRMAAHHDLILCVRGSTTGRRVVSDGDYCIGRGVCAIRCKLGLHTFIYKTVDAGLSRLLTKTTGSVFPSLSAPDIKQFLVLCPPLPVRLAFEACAAPLTARLQANHRQIHVLTGVRDALLPRLISGQIRMPGADAAAVELL